MSRKKNKKYPVARNTQIQKAGNEAASVSRLKMGEVGTLSLSRIQSEVRKMLPQELKWPYIIPTIEAMKQDATVATALDLKYLFVEKAFNSFTMLYNKENAKSKEAADFLEYCFKNMEGQTLRQVARNAASFNEYGFSIMEKIYTQVTVGEYAGSFKIKKLGFRPQASLDPVYPFKISEDGNSIVSINQTGGQNILPMGWMLSGNLPLIGSREIPAKKCMIFSYGGTDANPEGVSPLAGCYKAFREKILIENLEVVGATKDFGGVLELRIPSSILQKAAINPNGPDAEFVRGLMNDAANAHTGDQSYFMLPSDTNANGGKQYEMTLKGIDGGGKQYNTSELITARKKSILDRLGAGFINLGNDGQGSYNLSESKQTIHSHFVQRDIDIIQEVLNNDLIPQLLALNGITLSDKDMPRIKAGLIAEIDKDEFSKYVQRIASVGFLPRVPAVINQVLKVGGIEYRVPDDATPDELSSILSEFTSRAADGMEKGTGNGTSEDVSQTDNTVANMEN